MHKKHSCLKKLLDVPKRFRNTAIACECKAILRYVCETFYFLYFGYSFYFILLFVKLQTYFYCYAVQFFTVFYYVLLQPLFILVGVLS